MQEVETMHLKLYIVFLHDNVSLVKTIKNIAKYIQDKDYAC